MYSITPPTVACSAEGGRTQTWKVLRSWLELSCPRSGKVKNYTTLVGLCPLSHVAQHDLNAHSLTQRLRWAQVLQNYGFLPWEQRRILPYL